MELVIELLFLGFWVCLSLLVGLVYITSRRARPMKSVGWVSSKPPTPVWLEPKKKSLSDGLWADVALTTQRTPSPRRLSPADLTLSSSTKPDKRKSYSSSKQSAPRTEH